MSDAQIDGGDRGGNIEDSVGGWIGAEDDADAVRWYGIMALMMGYLIIPVYWWMEDLDYVALNWSWFRTIQAFFMPVGMGWLMVSFFDGQFMRAVFKDLVAVSLLGPFFAYWYSIAEYLLYSEVFEDELNFWLWGVFFIVHSLFQAVTQIILVPSIFRWSEKTDYLDNDKEKNLLALMF